jgi:aspartate-semialdehyde dehydrogenase
MGHRIAVVGATGNVGREILSTLAERGFPVADVSALATSASIGAQLSYGEDDLIEIKDVAAFDFKGIDIAIFAAGTKAAAEIAPKAVGAGAVVIDTSSYWRLEPDVPLVVPEVNPDVLPEHDKKGIVASPSAAATILAVALKPLHERWGAKRVVVSTYQAVSDAGREAMDELFAQTRAVYVNDPMEPKAFTKQIAFNVIPHVDAFMDDGNTQEEWRLAVETRKLLDPRVRVTATCVRVPVFIGHALSVNVEFEEPVSVEEAWQVWRETEGITVIDHRANEGYVTPVEVAGDDPVYISRAREDFTVENGLSFWCAADNLRKGAALNAVQIAEALIASWER